MKIVHIALMGPYTDNWSYQDNILPGMHSRQGHTVTVIAPCLKHAEGGAIVPVDSGDYCLEDGVRVIRLPLETEKGIRGKINNLLRPYKLYSQLCQLSPDLIMLHGLGQGISNFDIVKYLKRHRDCILVGDTHMYSTLAGMESRALKSRLVATINRYCRVKLYPFYKKVFGITPACVEYAVQKYGIPVNMVDLLPLGFDPALCHWEDAEQVRRQFRDKYGFAQDDFLIVHGGKVIQRRKTPETIEAVMKIEDPGVKLVIFGGIDSEMKPKVEPLLEKKSHRILYLGNLTPEEYHCVYCASDLALFPGGQSVLWQQAIGCGLPIVVGNDDDLEYLNRGGNAEFIDDTTAQGIYQKLTEVLATDKYREMKAAAEKEGRQFFSYEKIAKLVTDCVE